jgi:hypothetical protein
MVIFHSYVSLPEGNRCQFHFPHGMFPLPDLQIRLQMARLEQSTVECNGGGDGMIRMVSKYRGAK